VLGLIAGVIAKYLLGDRAKHGVIVTILIGIAGALVGGWAALELSGVRGDDGRQCPLWTFAAVVTQQIHPA
jgi:uncharacterized membrane protein YeaQ/YmgE (transglycosylase-associated protein family)